MSDPVTQAGIEDVLSSIRRLVSEDSRSQPAAAPEPAARLVLTPALRVQEPVEAPEAAAPQDADKDAAAEAPAAAFQDSPASSPDAAANPAVAFRHRRAGRGDGAAADGDAAARDAAASDAAEDSGSQAAAQPQAEPEQAGPPPPQPDAPDAPEAETEAPWGNPNATLFAAAAGAGSQAETAGARAASVVRKIAELEARSPRGQDQVQQWEPDSQTEAPFAGTGADTIEWRDAPLAGGAREMAETAVTGAALETLADSGDGYLDEDSLRDLVASIVREELQGALGERITRNVRKLVRREIHRALAAHDLV